MKLHRRSGGPALSGATVFDERLSVPWWWYPPALGAVGLVAFEVNLGHPGVPIWLPVALVAPLVAWGLYRLGGTRVVIAGPADRKSATGPVLRVGSATLPVRMIGEVQRIEPGDKQQALGPDLDPAAYLVHKAWVGPMVRVSVRDDEDPTPYWLFSVRHPEAFVQQLETGRSD